MLLEMEMLGHMPTLGFQDNTEHMYHRESYIFDIACLLLLSVEAAHTKNKLSIISHRWVTFILGIGFYTRVAEKNPYSLCQNKMLYQVNHFAPAVGSAIKYRKEKIQFESDTVVNTLSHKICDAQNLD